MWNHGFTLCYFVHTTLPVVQPVVSRIRSLRESGVSKIRVLRYGTLSRSELSHGTSAVASVVNGPYSRAVSTGGMYRALVGPSKCSTFACDAERDVVRLRQPGLVTIK